MLKIALPAFGKSPDFKGATKQSDVVLLHRKLNQRRLRKRKMSPFIGGDISAIADTSAIDVVTRPRNWRAISDSVMLVMLFEMAHAEE
jgi:hypothetical protein